MKKPLRTECCLESESENVQPRIKGISTDSFNDVLESAAQLIHRAWSDSGSDIPPKHLSRPVTSHCRKYIPLTGNKRSQMKLSFMFFVMVLPAILVFAKQRKT